MHKLRPKLPVVLLSPYGDAPPATDSLFPGSRVDVIEPLPAEQFLRSGPDRVTVRSQTGPSGSAADPMQESREEIGEDFSFVAASSVMRKIYAKAEVFAKVDVPILIVGESGSGKEVVCRLIHKLSTRYANRFLKVSCAALDPDFLERDLFDRERGTPSKGTSSEISPFTLCNKGTLLLDDIDEMPARAQAKLLCLLQDNQFLPGEKNTVDFDVRILATTKVDIETALLEGKLRKDLYYYLSACTILVPPLRERKDEIPLLMKHFMDGTARNYALPARDFPPALLLACQSYAWPGNLRELEKFVKRYLVSGDDETPWFDEEVDYLQKTEGMPATDFKPFESFPDTSGSKSLLHSVRGKAERNAITTALGQTKWNRRAAARLLNISYRTLLYKIQHYDMSPPRENPLPSPWRNAPGGNRV
jgi:DNA-binding NtrC family response regulator